MTKIDHKLLASNFSRASENYDRIVSAQLYAARKLASLITANTKNSGANLRILELGCGTGLLTRQIMSELPGAEFLVTDISPEMLIKCRKNTLPLRKKHGIKTAFEILDITGELPDEKFDIIAAGLAFQWVEDLSGLLRKLHKITHVSGKLFFSTLAENTFVPLRNLFAENNVEYPGPEFLSLAEITKACSLFTNCKICEESFQEEYHSAAAFLEHLRETGAGNATGHLVSPGILRKIIRQYPRLPGGGVSAEYHLVFTQGLSLD